MARPLKYDEPMTRTALRLPESLLQAIDAAVGRDGAANRSEWIVRALRAAVGASNCHGPESKTPTELPDGHEICKGCGHEIDPKVCHCGDMIDTHPRTNEHSPVPMGCQCGYADMSINETGDT